MPFIKIADVSEHKNRLCFYFSFDQNEGVLFAAKKMENGIVSSVRSESFYDVFAWIGFGSLAMTLYKSRFFAKKYRIKPVSVLHGLLIAATVNAVPVFFFKDNQRNWQWTHNESDITKHFGENILELVIQSAGRIYLTQLREYNKELIVQEVAYSHYLADKKTLESKHRDVFFA